MNDFMYRERHKTPRPLPANQLPLSEGTGYNSIFSSTSIHLAAPYLPSTKTNKKARVNFLFLLLSFCCFARADGLFCSNNSGGQMVLLRAIDLKHRELIFWVIELKRGEGIVITIYLYHSPPKASPKVRELYSLPGGVGNQTSFKKHLVFHK